MWLNSLFFLDFGISLIGGVEVSERFKKIGFKGKGIYGDVNPLDPRSIDIKYYFFWDELTNKLKTNFTCKQIFWNLPLEIIALWKGC